MLRVNALREDAVRLGSAEAFADRYGRGFLVMHGSKGGAVGSSFRTRNVDPALVTQADTGPMDVGVLSLVRKPQSTNLFVCIGRLDGNDVCLPDDTVSKLHAIVREDQRGVLTLLDARSRNGTWIDGALVAARGEGAATLLRSGQTIRFGSVTTTYLDAAAVYEMCVSLAP